MLHCTSSCRNVYLPVSSPSFVCRAHTQCRNTSKLGLQHSRNLWVGHRLRHRQVLSQRDTACASSLLDQAWGTHINAQARASAAPSYNCCIILLSLCVMMLQELATNIFSTSIIPYSAFLYWLTKSKKTPPLALFGFYFLLVFVFATIPAGVIGRCNLTCKDVLSYSVLKGMRKKPLN